MLPDEHRADLEVGDAAEDGRVDVRDVALVVIEDGVTTRERDRAHALERPAMVRAGDATPAHGKWKRW